MIVSRKGVKIKEENIAPFLIFFSVHFLKVMI